jgi:transcription elongation factor GreA-like protein
MSPRPLPDSPFNALRVPAVIATYSVGDRVSHDAYGIGTVVTVEADQAITLDFGDRQVRVVSPFRKVAKLSG